MEFILPGFRPYLEFAVRTGLRASAQVALKWQAVDSDFVHIELSRVRNREKLYLKIEERRNRWNYHNRFRAKAFPEWDFRYFSNKRAFACSLKAV